MTASLSSNNLGLFAAKLRNYVWLGIKLGVKSVDCKTRNGYVNGNIGVKGVWTAAQLGMEVAGMGAKKRHELGSLSLITPRKRLPLVEVQTQDKQTINAPSTVSLEYLTL